LQKILPGYRRKREIELLRECIRSANDNFFRLLRENHKRAELKRMFEEEDNVIRTEQKISLPDNLVLEQIINTLGELELEEAEIYKSYLIDMKRVFSLSHLPRKYVSIVLPLCRLEERCYETGERFSLLPGLHCTAELHAVQTSKQKLEIELGLHSYSEEKCCAERWEPFYLLFEGIKKRIELCENCPFKDYRKSW